MEHDFHSFFVVVNIALLNLKYLFEFSGLPFYNLIKEGNLK